MLVIGSSKDIFSTKQVIIFKDFFEKFWNLERDEILWSILAFFSHPNPPPLAILIDLFAIVAFFRMQSGVVVMKNKGSNKFGKHQVKQNQVDYCTLMYIMNFHKKNMMCRVSLCDTVGKTHVWFFTLSWKGLSLFQVFRMGGMCLSES